MGVIRRVARSWNALRDAALRGAEASGRSGLRTSARHKEKACSILRNAGYKEQCAVLVPQTAVGQAGR